MTRTVKASDRAGREGQGRPLGKLVAWLPDGPRAGYASADEHKFEDAPGVEARVEARLFLQGFDDAAPFFEHERPRRLDLGEDEEPVSVP